MFQEIDKTIFPDCCEVLEIVPSQQYVFPIFKCGKSSLYEHLPNTDWKLLTNDELQSIQTPITVFLRDPQSRFISGVNTYVQHLNQTNPGLDTKTVLWFVDNYLFLNRHYCPQFFWLMNLVRFVDPNVKLQFRSYVDVVELSPIHSNAGVEKPSKEFLQQIKLFDWKRLELYFYLDQILVDRIGQELSFNQLIKLIQTDYPELYQLVFEKTIKIVNALS